MTIEVLNDRSMSSVKNSHAMASRKTISKGDEKVSSSAANVKNDDVMLTDSAKALSRATSVAVASDGVDSAKVDKLKAAVRDGSYKINYESIANKMIDSESELSSIFG